jgi:acyl-CoA synthetase (AMP-forming)/AMP-acid ligase II
VTIVLHNSTEWIQAALAAWKLGAVPQPLSPQLPDAALDGLLELKPRALLVGRDDPRGVIPSVPGDFTPASTVSDVIAFLKDRIAAYKVPRKVEFSDTPLRDDAGKARRSAVRDEVIARRARARS